MVNFRDSKRISYLLPECSSCILDVASNYLKLSLSQSDNRDPNLEMKGMQELVKQLAIEFRPEESPNAIAQILFRQAIQFGNVKDPWKILRDRSNQIALSIIQKVEHTINQIQDKKKQLYEAIIWSVVGNVLDFGTAGHEFNMDSDQLNKTYKDITSEGFKINDFESIWDYLHRFKKCLYICDNAGEIAFDKLVIEKLQQLDVDVTAVVKGGPISNDAILDDAIQVGLDKVCTITTTGSPDLGFYPYANSKEFIKLLNNSPLVITKGQANWEAIYAYQDQLSPSINFFLIAKLKCNVHARLFNFPKGSHILYFVGHSEFREKKKAK